MNQSIENSLPRHRLVKGLGVEKLILCFLIHQKISDGDAVSVCNFVDVHTIDAYLLSLG